MLITLRLHNNTLLPMQLVSTYFEHIPPHHTTQAITNLPHQQKERKI